MSDEINLFCNLDVIEDREAHVAVLERVFRAVMDTRETPDGYQFKLPVERLNDVALWISNERFCCPFFHFAINLAPESDHLWLTLGGSEAVKALIQADTIDQIYQIHGKKR
ncbi:MAG: hypothetical protein L0154_13535 [Chloroflexi bacterium]|nr:hypothetical protein [Chloroflexota bacterium]